MSGLGGARASSHGSELGYRGGERARDEVPAVRQAKLPTPQSRYEVDRYRLDFAYPQVRLGIELEGYAFHSGRRAWARDLRRSNDLLRLGWTLLHFTWEDVTKHGDRVVDELRTHLLPNLLS